MNVSFPLTWTMTTASGGLAVTWHIENRSGADVWLLDTAYFPTATGYELQPQAISVMPSDEATLVRLVRGHLRPPPGQGVAVEYTPVARALAAGASAEGEATVPLPLRPWHPSYTTFPFKTAPRQARLEIGVLQGEPPEGVPAWETRFATAVDGTPLKVPTLGYVVQRQVLVVGESKGIPG